MSIEHLVDRLMSMYTTPPGAKLDSDVMLSYAPLEQQLNSGGGSDLCATWREAQTVRQMRWWFTRRGDVVTASLAAVLGRCL